MGMVDDRVVLVTGGGGGIGRAASLVFAREGAAHVVVADIDPSTAAATVEQVEAAGDSASVWEVDVTDEEAVAGMVAEIVDRHGRLDAAFNNAGINHPSTAFHELDRDSWEEMLATNLTSVFLCMKHELRQMSAQDSGGVIVNTSSGAGVVPAPGQPHYTAAKHGILGLTRSAAAEYIRSGVRCNSVLPGMVDTPMLHGPDGRMSERAAALVRRVSPTGAALQPSQIASVAVWLCSDGASAVNGQALVIDGGGIMH